MKKLLLLFVVGLTICSVTYSQTPVESEVEITNTTLSTGTEVDVLCLPDGTIQVSSDKTISSVQIVAPSSTQNTFETTTNGDGDDDDDDDGKDILIPGINTVSGVYNVIVEFEDGTTTTEQIIVQ